MLTKEGNVASFLSVILFLKSEGAYGVKLSSSSSGESNPDFVPSCFRSHLLLVRAAVKYFPVTFPIL